VTETLDRPAVAPPLRFGQLFGRIVLAGLVAGVLAGLYSLLVTERAIRPALDLEEARAAAGGGHEHGGELFSRPEQLLGGFLGTVLAGVVLAVVFAAVYGLVRHRLPGRTDVARTTLLAAIGFGVLALLPALKIPANPPAVGDPATVGTRTAIYGGVLLCGVVGAMLLAALVSWLRGRGAGDAVTAIAATVAGVVLLALVLVLVPDNPDTIAADVPAAVVWNFRLASLGQLAVLWAGLGLAAGWLLDALPRRRAVPAG
jgi:predicted cobalt transporter CbtA